MLRPAMREEPCGNCGFTGNYKDDRFCYQCRLDLSIVARTIAARNWKPSTEAVRFILGDEVVAQARFIGRVLGQKLLDDLENPTDRSNDQNDRSAVAHPRFLEW